MEQPISRPLHGVLLDYPYVALVAAAPALAGFDDNPAATVACRVFSGTALAYSLLTRYEAGVAPVIPYNTHLALDLAAGVAAFAAPWVLGFARNDRARNTFLAMGAAGLIAATFSRRDGD